MSSASQHLPEKQRSHQTPSPVIAQGLGLGSTPRLGGASLLPTSHGVSSSSQPRKARSEPGGPAAGPTLAPALEKKLTSRNKGFCPYLRVWSGAARGLRGEISSSRGWVVPPGRPMWGVDEPSLETSAFFSRCPNQQGTPLCASKVLLQHLPHPGPGPADASLPGG